MTRHVILPFACYVRNNVEAIAKIVCQNSCHKNKHRHGIKQGERDIQNKTSRKASSALGTSSLGPRDVKALSSGRQSTVLLTTVQQANLQGGK